MRYLWILLLTPLLAQTTFTEAEALEMIKARDAQWEGKLAKADSLIESQKVVISDCEKYLLLFPDSVDSTDINITPDSTSLQLNIDSSGQVKTDAK